MAPVTKIGLPISHAWVGYNKVTIWEHGMGQQWETIDVKPPSRAGVCEVIGTEGEAEIRDLNLADMHTSRLGKIGNGYE